VNRSVGKLFLTTATGGKSSCTAAVVDAPNQSTLLTAGHCVNSPQNGLRTVSFAPGYHEGIKPFGEWASFRILQPGPWAASYNRRYDFAFVVIRRNAKRKAVEDAVGALPIAFNQPRNQPYRIFGIPAEPPYDGERLWACDSTGFETGGTLPGPSRVTAGCDFHGGASGGPWLSGQGAVGSVISEHVVLHPDVTIGPYLGDEAAALFALAGNVSTAPPRKCKKKGKGKTRAAAAKKKCKKKRKKR
jgi:V8-like Glu-specific endopeptidase